MPRRCGLVLAAFLLGITPALSADKDKTSGALDQLQERELNAVEDAAARQKRIDAADDDTRQMASEYSRLKSRIERLESHKGQLTKLLADQVAELASIEKQIERVPAIEQQAFPMMKRMVETLDAFIRADMPFSLKSRLNTVAELKEQIDRAVVSPSEKFRKIFDAYKHELDYGRTIHAYDGEFFENTDETIAKFDAKQPEDEQGTADAEVDAASASDDTSQEAAEPKRLVTFLRYGRVGFAYQSFDGADTGIWDKEKRGWKPVEGQLAREIKSGIAVAYKRVPPDIMIVPAAGGAK
jgi:septal ring factor EnvC (AmiA/AmiB activator)